MGWNKVPIYLIYSNHWRQCDNPHRDFILDFILDLIRAKSDYSSTLIFYRIWSSQGPPTSPPPSAPSPAEGYLTKGLEMARTVRMNQDGWAMIRHLRFFRNLRAHGKKTWRWAYEVIPGHLLTHLPHQHPQHLPLSNLQILVWFNDRLKYNLEPLLKKEC